MNIFADIVEKCQHPHICLFIDTLNKYRISLTQQCRANTKIQRSKIQSLLFNLQMEIFQNQYTFDLKKLDHQNLINLMTLIKNKKQTKNKKYNIDWTSMSSKNTQNKKLPLQKVQQLTIKNQRPKQGTLVKKQNGYFFHNQQKQKKNISSRQNKYQPKVEQSKPSEKISSIVDFVSASVLPKSVSVRKKFMPPFKKAQIQTIKQENQNQEDQKCQDSVYKGLEKKLIETIQSQILETRKNVKWEDIAGLEFAKTLINEMIVWPMLRPDIFTGLRAPPRGILLFGPPGTGKTMIGRAIASSANATFFNISASSLTSKWVGQSQKLVRTLFQIARIKQPSVIFIDEIDSLLCARSQGEQQSSRRLDGTKTSQNERILIIGATNLPQQLDDAVRRRFIKRLYIPLPNSTSRFQLLETLTSNSTFCLQNQDKLELASVTKGFSGADIHSLCKQASMIPLRQIHSIQKIRFSQVPSAKVKHFKQAMKFVRPSVNKKALSKYQDWNQQFGSYQLNPDDIQQ